MARKVDSRKLNDWIQSVTGIAILIGLALVVFELQQSRNAIKSQLTSDGYSQINQVHASMLGEEPAKVIAKACYSPNELTPHELVILDNYYNAIISRTSRMKRLSDRGGFYTEDDWKSAPGWALLFETAPGRAYWATFPVNPAIKVVGDQALIDRRESGELDCKKLFGSWREHIAKEAGDPG